MMRYLLISFFCLLIVSCKNLKITNNLTEEIVSQNIRNPYFSNINVDYIYKAKITAGKNNFGGLLIVKKLKEEHHRVVFTTEFGNKIFDFEFIKDTFKVNSVLKELDKGIILNALKKDYALLIKEKYLSETKINSEKEIIYKVKAYKKDNYFAFNQEDHLFKIVMASKRKEKMTILFEETENEIAKEIIMKHHNFNMITVLNYINN